MICIYKITSPSGKIYIGSTSNFKARIKHYKSLDCKAQRKLHYSLKKHGFDNHVIDILEECTNENLFERERYYGELYEVTGSNGLNLALPGYGEVKSLTSSETIEKMKASQKKENNNFFGRKHTPETIEKLKKALANKSKETLLKMRLAQLGKKAPIEVRQKMADSQRGRKHSKETKEKMRFNKNLKIVVCTQTGIFYNGSREAAAVFGYNPHTLRNKLSGQKRNNTRFVHA